MLFQSPGDCSLPSLCSPDHDDEPLGLMSLTADSGGSELEEDLCLKAPYIPLDEDLPLLIPAVDLMWTASPSPSPPPPQPSRTETSSLAELLRTSPEALRGVRSNKRTGVCLISCLREYFILLARSFACWGVFQLLIYSFSLLQTMTGLKTRVKPN